MAFKKKKKSDVVGNLDSSVLLLLILHVEKSSEIMQLPPHSQCTGRDEAKRFNPVFSDETFPSKCPQLFFFFFFVEFSLLQLSIKQNIKQSDSDKRRWRDLSL